MRNLTLLLLFCLGVAACEKGQDQVLAESEVTNTTTFTLTFENTMRDNDFFQSGKTEMLLPNESESYRFVAGIGMHLSFVSMLTESNDLFLAFEEEGFPLYNDEGEAITGEITQAVRLWDAGTEVNEVLGEGSNQAPRQNTLNLGTEEDGVVQLVDSLQDDLFYPSLDSIISISLAYEGESQFVLTIENISNEAYLSSPFSAGVFSIHQKGKYLFKANETASANLEAIAEDGDNTFLWERLRQTTGFTSIFGTGIYLVHQASHPIFTEGEKDRGQGLEILAEYGNPENLFDVLRNRNDLTDVGIFQEPEGNSVLNLGGKLVPGNRYVFSFQAKTGDFLSIANMLVETNDLFFSFNQGGLELFPNGEPVIGDVTHLVNLWDAGTETNEFPGAGAFQPIRNGAKESVDEGGVVHLVNDGFSYPAIEDLVRVMIEVE